MSDNFKLLTELFVCACRGTEYTRTLTPSQRSALLSLSSFHGVSSLIMLVLSEDNENARRQIKRKLFTEQTKNVYLTSLLNELESGGVETLVIKGRAVGRFYAISELRDSADTDLLIKEDDETAAYEIMRKNNCQVVPRTSYSHHATCRSERLGTIELHTSLFFEMLGKVLFNDIDQASLVCEEPVTVCDGELKYKTLGYTDHLIFLTLHMIQHFIRSGTSLRQIFDILIYTEKCRDKIDMARYNETISSLGFSGILDTVYTVGVKYFGSDESDLPSFHRVSDEVADEFMDDIESGGWIGKAREDGEELFRYYGSTRADDVEGYTEYLKRYQRKKMISSIFPDRKRIADKFPFAEKALLLPFGWLCWLVYGVKLYVGGELRSDASGGELGEWQRARLKLFSDMNL